MVKKKIVIKNKKIKRYKLPKNNIISLNKNSEIRKKHKDYFAGLKDEGIEWPVEIQGTGLSDFKKKEFKIWYPEGDVFLSFAITFHELGHLRQGEIDKDFATDGLGASEQKLKDEEVNHNKSENDAWQRGFDRVKKYCPEEFQKIEEKFQGHKNKGKFKEYKNFEEFFNYIVRMGLKITEFNGKVELPEEEDKRKKGRLIGKMIKEDKLTNDFFTKQEGWRTGEKIDKDFAESFIKKAAEKIAKEKY
jgi:hypothetical protein